MTEQDIQAVILSPRTIELIRRSLKCDQCKHFTDQEIRLKSIELSNHGMGPDLNYAKRIEMFIKSGEVMTISEVQNKEAKSA